MTCLRYLSLVGLVWSLGLANPASAQHVGPPGAGYPTAVYGGPTYDSGYGACDGAACDGAACGGGCCTVANSSCGQWIGTGEYLYMRTRQTPRAFAGQMAGPPIGLDPVNNQVLGLNQTEYDFDSGCRLGLGYVTPAGWEARFTYSTYHTTGDQVLGNPAQDTNRVQANLIDRNLAGTAGLINPFFDGGVDFAWESIDLEYDVFDLEMGRYVAVCGGLTLRPLAGIRFADIDQTSSCIYQNRTGADIDSYLLLSAVDLNAYGLRMGSEVHWGLGDTGLSVFARGTMSILAAEFELRRTDVAINTSAPQNNITRNVNHDVETVVPVLDLSLGLRYEIGSCYLGAGYQFANWFNMQQHLDVDQDDVLDGAPTISTQSGDLGLDGLYVEVGFIR